PKCASSWRVWRVSSAQTAAASFSTASARGLMSPRLPIGVATTNNVPDVELPGLCIPAFTMCAGRILAGSRTSTEHVARMRFLIVALLLVLAGCASVDVQQPHAAAPVYSAPFAQAQ